MDRHQIVLWLAVGESVGALLNYGNLKARKKKINLLHKMENCGRFWLVTLHQFWAERGTMTNNRILIEGKDPRTKTRPEPVPGQSCPVWSADGVVRRSLIEGENKRLKSEVILSRFHVKHFSTQLIFFIDFCFLINFQKWTNHKSPLMQRINSI